MLGLGWAELAIISILAIFVVGPKDIPKIMYGLGKVLKRLSYIRYAFSQQFEDFMKESELKELQEEAEKRSDDNVEKDI